MTLEEHTKKLKELADKFNMPLDPRRQAEIYKEFEKESNLKENPTLAEEYADIFRLRKIFYFKLEKDFDYAHIYGFISPRTRTDGGQDRGATYGGTNLQGVPMTESEHNMLFAILCMVAFTAFTVLVHEVFDLFEKHDDE